MSYVRISSEERKKIKSYLPDYLEQKGINSKEMFHCLNPEHKDKNPSMKMSGDPYFTCHCFGCNQNYNIFDLVALDNNLDIKADYQQVLLKIKDLYPNCELEFSSKKEFKEVHDNPLVDYTNYFQSCKKSMRRTNYLQKRGISLETAEKYNVGFDERRNCIIFPIDQNHYFARAIIGNEKYNSKGNVRCWNEPILQNKPSLPAIIITEGIIDALSLEEAGCKQGLIALNGVTNYTRVVKLIKENDYQGIVVLALDNDEVGKMYTKKLKEELKLTNNFVLEYAFTLDNKDANEELLANPKKLKDSLNYLDTVINNLVLNLQDEKAIEDIAIEK